MKRQPWSGVDIVPRILFVAVAILFGTIGVALAWESLFHRESPTPVAGSLDLSHWDFSSSGTILLGGTWEFEPERLVNRYEFGQTDKPAIRHVPDTRFAPRKDGFFSGTGSGTYRLEVRLPSGTQDLGLRVSTVWTAFEIEANGVVVAATGRPGLPPQKSEPGYGAAIVRLEPLGDKLEILVRVSNQEYRWGGIVQPFVLGNRASLIAQKRWDDMMVFLMVGALLGIGANALFLFAYRRHDPVYLSFTAFALTVALRALTSGDGLLSNFFPDLSFDMFVRLGFTAQYLLIPTAAIFFHRLFIEDIPLARLFWLIVPSLVFCALLPWASVNILSWSLLPYFVVAMAQLAYGYVAIALRPAIKHRPGAGIVLAAGTILLGAILLNVRAEVFLSRAESGFPLGLTAFVIVQSLVMARRFTWVFEKTESLSQQLTVANRNLMEEARSAEEARDQLEVAVAEKDVLLHEVHHRVRNSLQIVLSIINLQVRRATDPGVLAAYSSVRDRIRAISTVHDRLFGLDSEKRVDLTGYSQELLRHLEDSYGSDTPLFQVEAEPVWVPMDLCLEMGLILTELVINAFRHAQIPLRGGKISVTLRYESDRIALTVADDGPGFPEGFRTDSDKTVGFKIVGGLVAQRRGNLSAFNRSGAVVKVDIPYRENAKTLGFTA